MLKRIKYAALGILAVLVLYSAYRAVTAGPEQFVNSRTVDAPSDSVWAMISDVGNYHEVTNDKITDVKILSGKDVGMKRACYSPEGAHWTETCTEWVPGSHYTFVVDTEAENYPFPMLKSLQGTWAVEALTSKRSEIILTFEYEFRYPWFTWMIQPFARSQAEKDTRELLDNWERMAEQM